MASQTNLSEVFQGGATTSQHVDAKDEDHFEQTSFKLKRTRSLGLLDDFIQPTQKLVTQSDFVSDDTVSKINTGTKCDSTTGSKTYMDLGSDLGSTDIVDGNGNDSAYKQTQDGSAENEEQKLTEPDNQSEKNEAPNSAYAAFDNLVLTHDDNDLEYEPSKHVDYLSHNWKESDIFKSWRYVVLKRKDVANSSRLENASWRTWAQAKYGLKTISPESVNWYKDSDVTWLYGPLYKEPHKQDLLREDSSSNLSMMKNKRSSSGTNLRSLPKTNSFHDSIDLDKINNNKGKRSSAHDDNTNDKKHNDTTPIDDDQPKSILKKKTIGEIMLEQATFYANKNRFRGSPVLDAHQQPESPISLSNNTSRDHIGDSFSVDSPTPSIEEKKDRHIHFNDRVEQCMAVDLSFDEEDDEEYYQEPSLVNKFLDTESNQKEPQHLEYAEDSTHNDSYDENNDDYDDEDEEDDDDDDDEEGGFFLRARSPSNSSLHHQGLAQLSMSNSGETQGKINSDNSSSCSTTTRRSIIEILPATTLKYGSDDDEEYALSHNVNTSRGYDYHYDYNTVYEAQTVNDDNLEVYDVPSNIDLASSIPVPKELATNIPETAIGLPKTVGNSRPVPPETTTVKANRFMLADSDSDTDNSNDDDRPMVNSRSSGSYASLSDIVSKMGM
ncbi:Protein phosphatase type 1 regulatory subunit [Komagataella phaffii CBS 7435]|uniref:Regulatory subunit of type 1 protein phosphatase Glc7p n=2 Tax=Komagataella phaffii TaxID=460519 RepID=C4QW14_KOMPG|nr:Regulatory subunit of type 1 protein phosphatase Glc7p [Komagataella phaffii GS115]AOA60892.1 GQ67_02645T0 [Komagataella phaffii]CAH2446103.1 Protein phosphatase type 1 regulatory subunit [Komagataella phaffii CBS 7435]AOA66691.1 GQ68_02603T0 [Komagataella phaffii GS115]CAY67437.1 Regulatory subunit of type 1 protein phosphatase Glc7p [Komagataella phaffii GS115]CCA36537.1 Protein phosphatase type 1 regulatory subunit [Komagataella phaffii CBS 7435]